MRTDDWPERLALFFLEKQAQPFDWQNNNCCFFACDWLAILTGEDPAAEYRARATDALGAARVLSEEGGVEAIAELVCAEKGWPEIGIKLAGRGDVVLLDTPDGPALGVCDGLNSGFAGPAGLTFKRTLGCRRAWRIL